MELGGRNDRPLCWNNDNNSVTWSNYEIIIKNYFIALTSTNNINIKNLRVKLSDNFFHNNTWIYYSIEVN